MTHPARTTAQPVEPIQALIATLEQHGPQTLTVNGRKVTIEAEGGELYLQGPIPAGLDAFGWLVLVLRGLSRPGSAFVALEGSLLATR